MYAYPYCTAPSRFVNEQSSAWIRIAYIFIVKSVNIDITLLNGFRGCSYIGNYSYADRLESALKRVLSDPANHTVDIKSKRSTPPAKTSDFVRAVIVQLQAHMK